jgi:type II secretory pathway component PulK
MALIMAMIVVVLITMLVAGAISFTGTERAAAEVQTQEAAMSACTQAARNLFLSKLKRISAQDIVQNGVDFMDLQFAEILQDQRELRTGHLGGVRGLSARRAGALDDKMKKIGNISNTTQKSSETKFYIVTVVCSDPTIAGGPEREIEFMVRTGLN